MNVLIATPSYGGTVTTEYMVSILNLIGALSKNGIKCQVAFQNLAEIIKVRNFFATKMLDSPEYSHMLFVDADMQFNPETILHMLAFNKPVVGCLYPKRFFDINEFYKKSREHDTFEKAYARTVDFVVEGGVFDFCQNTSTPSQRKPQLNVVGDRYVRSTVAGTGLMLIQSEVFSQIKQRYPELWLDRPIGIYKRWKLENGVLQCFESIQGSDGMFCSEDIAFCRRWVEGCGGEIWVDIKDEIGHMGQFLVESAFMNRL